MEREILQGVIRAAMVGYVMEAKLWENELQSNKKKIYLRYNRAEKGCGFEVSDD